MYRDSMQLLSHDDHRFILHHGALGDVICSLPALIHARRSTDETMKMTVYVPQAELVAHLLKPYGAFDVRPFTEAHMKHSDRQKHWPNAHTSMNAPPFNTHTRNRVHMVDFAFNYLIDARPEDMKQRSYPTLAPLGNRLVRDDYVVFPVGATSDNKLFRASVMSPVIEWVAEKGLTPVIVGTKVSNTLAEASDGTKEKIVIRDEVDKLPENTRRKCLDLRECTTLLQLRDVCGHAQAVVGVDGGTIHLAGTTDTNIIYAAGTTLPKHRYIARNGDPSYKIRYVGPRDLECTGCQSNWQMTHFDFRFCQYGDNKCMELLHPDDFINGLKELGI